MSKSASNRKDITGQIFGQITVKNYSHTIGKKAYWVCVCSCGKELVIHGISLRCGNTKSCGHDRYINAAAASKIVSTKHGMEGTPTYRSWKSMKERCLKENHKSYAYYKSIEICQSWIDSFESFLSDMGIRPEGTTLDRKDNNDGYNKDNCRWATHKEQARNRSSSVFLDIKGEQKTIAEWCEIYNMPNDTVRYRLKSGWSPLRALTTPIKSQKNNREGYPIKTKMITVINRYGEAVRVAEWSKA